jgi:hypothetical protein
MGMPLNEAAMEGSSGSPKEPSTMSCDQVCKLTARDFTPSVVIEPRLPLFKTSPHRRVARS